MRIACYGWVERNGASVAGANYELLSALLGCGHDVTFFAKRDHVRIDQFPRCPNYHGVIAGSGSVDRRLAPVVERSNLLLTQYNRVRGYRNRRLVAASMEAAHQRRPFDVVLLLGVRDLIRINGLPSVAWPQSPPGTEARAYVDSRESIRAYAPLWKRSLLLVFNSVRLCLLRPSRDATHYGDLVVTQSEWAKERFVALGIPARRVRVIPYPISALSTAATTRQVESMRPSGPTLVHVGRLDPRKRPELLLDAFALVRRAHPTARLIVAGRPGYIPEVTELFAAHRPGVTYLREVPRPQVASLLQEADLLVQTSCGETFGTAVAEALSMGVNVVVGPDNGTAQYVDDFSGVFRSYDAPSVAKTICETLERCRVNPTLARASARRAALRFEPKAAGGLLEAALMAAISER